MTDSKAQSAVFYRSPHDDYPMIIKADGIRVWDDRGHELVDLTSGISSAALIGQGRTEIGDAVRDQIAQVSYIHSSAATSFAQEELARRLVDLAPPDLSKVMFSSGGSEANEVALRIVRQFHIAQGEPERRAVIALHPSYHGATAGALSLTGRWDISRDYEPFLFPVRHVPAPVSYLGPFRGLDGDELAERAAGALEATIESIDPSRVAAFVVEPISLSTGMSVPPTGYWQRVRDICDRHGIVFMVDEVITGMGRTGTVFRSDSFGVSPDVITLAKGLAGGYAPLGATLVSTKIAETIAAGRRRMAEVHTHSGAPIPCAVGLAVLNIIERERLVEGAEKKGAFLRELLLEHIAPMPFIGEIRGIGLFQGVTYATDPESRNPLPVEAQIARSVNLGMRERGYLSRTMHHESAVVRDCTGFTPALTIDHEDLERGVLAFRSVLEQLRPSWEAYRDA